MEEFNASQATPKNARKPISKKLRFETFSRDGFTCSYCGSSPSKEGVVLEIDHFIPVSKGGDNNPRNLLTSCFSCNRGKGASDIRSASIPIPKRESLMREREEQIREYYSLLQSIKDREENEIWEVARIFMNNFHEEYISKKNFSTIRMFLSKLDFYSVQWAMEVATERVHSKNSCFSYFCGICWNKIKENGE